MAAATHNLDELKRRMQGAISVLKQELGGLRTGRASAGLVDHVQVEAYGSHMPLNQVATVSVPEPRMLSVQVWDRRWCMRSRRGSRRQPRADAEYRGSDDPPAHPRAERGAAQGTGEGGAQICRGRARRGPPCSARRPRSAEEDGKGSHDQRGRAQASRRCRCRRRPTRRSRMWITRSPPKKKRS